MWIRSQNKQVITKLKNIRLKEIKENEYRILERINQEEDLILGIYSTKEKALKVLDEIQECLLKYTKGIKFSPDIMRKINFIFAEPFVYQMPRDDEVGDE